MDQVQPSKRQSFICDPLYFMEKKMAGRYSSRKNQISKQYCQDSTYIFLITPVIKSSMVLKYSWSRILLLCSRNESNHPRPWSFGSLQSNKCRLFVFKCDAEFNGQTFYWRDSKVLNTLATGAFRHSLTDVACFYTCKRIFPGLKTTVAQLFSLSL